MGYLAAALAPPPFKASVLDEIFRNCNKKLKYNLLAFVEWLQEVLTSYMRWERSESAARILSAVRQQRSPSITPSTAATVAAANDTQNRPRGRPNGGRGGGRRVAGPWGFDAIICAVVLASEQSWF